MITYKAAYKFVEGGVHAQVLDFPEAISCGVDLVEARQMIASALLDLAEQRREQGLPMPVANPLLSDPNSDVEEPLIWIP